MERAGKSLAKMKLPEAVSHQDLAFAAFNSSVGKRLAKIARPKALVRGNLIVETDDPVWQQQLFHLRFQILPKLTGILGGGIVNNLEFRIATPRRPPQQAQVPGKPASSDEADRIPDSIFRSVYKQARKKASA
jgi:hypothetical protein